MTVNNNLNIQKNSKTTKTKIIVKPCYSKERSITEAFTEVIIRNLNRKKS